MIALVREKKAFCMIIIVHVSEQEQQMRFISQSNTSYKCTHYHGGKVKENYDMIFLKIVVNSLQLPLYKRK